jgi:demethylmenaquinone methyltransferase/2-methoxy-6-polyprenyl-1,4-benzoquinol methylase
MQGNALRLPFTDHSFDCTTIGFGLRNAADIKGALSTPFTRQSRF